MINVIETDFGNIIELYADKDHSVAMICIDGGKKEPPQKHPEFAEMFEHIKGSGLMASNRGTRIFSTEGDKAMVEKDDSYTLANRSTDQPWLFYAICRPPFPGTKVRE